MCIESSAYRRFARVLVETPEILTPEMDFSALCKHLHVSPVSLEEIIYRELGYKGDEILQSFHFLLDL